MKDEFKKEDLKELIHELNERLKADHIKGSIFMTGGAVFTLKYSSRDMTVDIDALYEPKETINQYVKEIAKSQRITQDWLNDGVKGFFSDKIRFEPFLELSNLMVYTIKPECLLALKLTAAREVSKDFEDAKYLMHLLDIKEAAECLDLIDQYALPNQKTILAEYFTESVYAAYKIEKILPELKMGQLIKCTLQDGQEVIGRYLSRNDNGIQLEMSNVKKNVLTEDLSDIHICREKIKL